MNAAKIIYNHQLSNNKYDIKTLETNINRLSLKKLLNTQILTYDFCVTYLLHPETYAMGQEDNNITIEDIKIYQPHLSSNLFVKTFTNEKINKRKDD